MAEHRLNVMHVVFSLETGGLENGVVNLCNLLDPDRFCSSVCVFQSGGELESRLDLERVELVKLKRHWNYDPSLPLRLAWQLRKRGIDILHTHSWGTLVEGFVAAKLARTRRIVHGEHGILEQRPRNIRLQKLLWAATHQVTSVAATLADSMSEVIGFDRERIRVIPNGVDTVRFCPRPVSKKLRCDQFGLPRTGLLAGMVARLVPVKNHLGVLHAISDLKAKSVPVTLALAGDGPLLSELKRVTSELGLVDDVCFLGDIPDVDQFLNSLDLFVLNSDSEGMSNTVLEAMSSGLPVVATAVGSNPDLVEDGVTGHLIPKGDSPALARAVALLASESSTRESMGRQGRVRIERFFGVDQMVRAYSELYHELGETRQPTARVSSDMSSRDTSQELDMGPTAYTHLS